jgi:hypothetical protein
LSGKPVAGQRRNGFGRVTCWVDDELKRHEPHGRTGLQYIWNRSVRETAEVGATTRADRAETAGAVPPKVWQHTGRGHTPGETTEGNNSSENPREAGRKRVYRSRYVELRSRLRVERFELEAKAHEGEKMICLRRSLSPRPQRCPKGPTGNGKGHYGPRQRPTSRIEVGWNGFRPVFP